MIKKLLLLIVLCTLMTFYIRAQGLYVNWTKQIGGSSSDGGASVAVDNHGNVYTLGEFMDTVDFDSGTGVFNFISNGDYDISIQKLDSNGNFLWAKQIGGHGRDFAGLISTDNSGNLYISGIFMDTVDFDPGAGIFNLISYGEWDMFIQKLDSSGNFLWVKQMGGKGWDYTPQIKLDAKGNIYSTGSFSDTVDFDPGIGIYNLISKGNTDIFVQKLDPNGNFQWAKQMGGIGYDGASSITTDVNGNIYITGNFEDTVDFDPGLGINNLISISSDDIFIQKLDSNGNFLWVKQMSGNIYLNSGGSSSITTDIKGNVYSTGEFQNIDIDPGTGVFNLISNGGFDIYIQKLDADGNFLWAKQMGGTGLDYSSSITTDANGNIYTTGDFQNTVDFDPGSEIFNLTSNGGYDIYIQKLDSNGNFLWAKQMGGIGTEHSNSIICDINGSVYCTGNFSNTVYFDSTICFISNGNGDIFIEKLNPCNSPFMYSTQTISACHSYNLYNQTVTTSGIYNQIIGCDSIISTNLTIFSTDASVFDNGINLTANATGAYYQWINCNGNVPITGDTSQSFTPTVNGNYAVVVTKNGCSDTSLCFNMTSVDVNNHNLEYYVAVYPNPFSLTSTLETNLNMRDATLIIYNSLGLQVNILKNISGQKITLKRDNLSCGFYFLQLIQDNMILTTEKIVITNN